MGVRTHVGSYPIASWSSIGVTLLRSVFFSTVIGEQSLVNNILEQCSAEVHLEGTRDELENPTATESCQGGHDDKCAPKKKAGITVNDVKTVPMDYRFPTTNQAKHCYTNYNEFHRCAAEKGKEAKECQKYAKFYRSLCPGEWVTKWNEERAAGTFPGRY